METKCFALGGQRSGLGRWRNPHVDRYGEGGLPVNPVSWVSKLPGSSGPIKPCPEDESGHAHLIGNLGQRVAAGPERGKPVAFEGVSPFGEERGEVPAHSGALDEPGNPMGLCRPIGGIWLPAGGPGPVSGSLPAGV